jgi:hypothetical protein
LLAEGGANIADVDDLGYDALVCATLSEMADNQWLIEHGGADMAFGNPRGQSEWDLRVLTPGSSDAHRGLLHDVGGVGADAVTAVTALLQVMVLHGAPPPDIAARMLPVHALVVEEGARLRARLPAYLARQRALLDEHYPLIPPLRDLVHGYEEPTTTEELWATGIGAAP